MSEISNASSDFVYFWKGEEKPSFQLYFPDVGPVKPAPIGGQPTEVPGLWGVQERILSVALQSLQIAERFLRILTLMY